MMKNKSSEYAKLYEKGSAVAEYLLNVKIFEIAKAGDLKAIEKYQRLIEQRNRAK